MPRIKVITLTPEQQTALEHGYRTGPSAAFRKRCQIILLKSQHRTSQDVAQMVGCCEIVDCCEMVVNNWMVRYQQEGIAGLHTKPGRGRKAILDADTDLESVREAVRGNRQRLRVAKADLEEALGKSFSDKTLRRFLKDTLHAINAFESVPVKSQSRTSTN
jgi:transposase